MTPQQALPADFFVKVVPRAARNEIVGWTDGVLRVRVHAPPVDGQANAALLDVLSEYAGLPPSSFHIVHGAKGRLKRVRVGKS